MESLDEKQCRRILEVAPDATSEEITQAYQLLKRIHGKPDAWMSAPAMDEFSADTRTGILRDLEAAYAHLRTLEGAQPQPQAPPIAAPPTPPVKPDRPESSAAAPPLRRAREAAGLSLDQVFSETHVRLEYLQALEEERFADLPLATVNVRGYLTALVTAIGLSPEEVVPPYMEKFKHWQAHPAAQ